MPGRSRGVGTLVEVDISVVRGGYGYARRKGPFRLHLEATLNAPFNGSREKDGFTGLFDALSTLFPIGFGVHYAFGQH